MGILISIVLLVFISIGLWLFFKLLKWVFTKKIRVILVLLCIINSVISVTIYQLFFVKMEFIQSKVYTDLYLVKHPLKNKDSLNKAIKEKVLQLVKNEMLKEKRIPSLRFYKYSKGDFLENGTVYFLNYKEKSEGMFPELLEYYPEYLLAEFSINPCFNDSVNYFGKLVYYRNEKQIKTDSIFNTSK